MKQVFKLLVFDWDGTLMDSEARIVDCMRSAIADLGVEVPDDEAIRDIIGLGLSEAVRSLLPYVESHLIDAAASRYRHHFLHQNETPSTLFPRVAETLRNLSHAGYLLAVATGKGRRGLDEALRRSGLEVFFHATRCADETASKPHPEMLLQLMAELGSEPAETLMIGDTEYDMQMASNARTPALGVTYGVHSPQRLLASGPLGCVDDIAAVPDWLQRHTRAAGGQPLPRAGADIGTAG